MTDEVAALVLRDNYEQARALGNARAQAALAAAGAPPDDHRAGAPGRARPGAGGAADRTTNWPPGEAGRGLTAPEFAVLLAYVKIVLEREVLADGLVDEAWTTDVLVATSRRRCASGSPTGWPATGCAGRSSRRCWSTRRSTGAAPRSSSGWWRRAAATAADVIRAYVVVREVFGLRELWDAVEALDNQVPTRRCRPPSSWTPGGCSTGRCAGWSPTAGRRSTCRRRSPGCATGWPSCCRGLEELLLRQRAGVPRARTSTTLTDRGLPRTWPSRRPG